MHMQTVLLGDFNIDLSEGNEPPQNKKLLQFCEQYNLREVIHPQTTTDYNTTIDHIYTNIENTRSGVAEIHYSYHKAVWIALSDSSTF
jgi:endonuclease/exonuclease/phosphatase family metal-dependent hydrolase